MDAVNRFLGNVDPVAATIRESASIKNPRVTSKNCMMCNVYKTAECYPRSNSRWHLDHLGTVCFECLEEMIGDPESNVTLVDEIFQDLNLEFQPHLWLSDAHNNPRNALQNYLHLRGSYASERINWKTIKDEWIAALKRKEVSKKFDEITEQDLAELKLKWGSEYSEEYLKRLEHSYKEIENTQSVTTEIQKGHAKKMCMLSLQIEQLIQNGTEHMAIKNLIGAYDSLAKTADFTPKNAKNIGDFESIGELCAFLEKRGWINKFYDWNPKDKLDEVIENLQAYTRRIVTGESGIADELNKKLENLKIAQELEHDMSEDKFDKYTTVDIEEDLTEELGEEFKL